MFEEHPAFRTPADSQKIWRYMDMSKFLSILEKRALHFTRADRFEDPFEGSLPSPTSDRFNTWRAVQLERADAQAKKFYMPDRVLRTRCTIGINCWHLNEYESSAMWRLYLKSNEGIAIQSTVGRLKQSFCDSPERIFIGMVNYLDYGLHDIPTMDTFSPFLAKRISFSHENELRALIWDHSTANADELEPISENRLDVAVGLESLIERVYLAPETPAWLEGLVQDVLRRYDVLASVKASDLKSQPLF